MRKLLPASLMKNGIYSSTFRPADDFTADQVTVVHSYCISAGHTAYYPEPTSPEATRSHRADILMLKILTTWSAPALASWTQARSSFLSCPPWPALPGLGLQRSLFTISVWLWLWWAVKKSHKHGWMLIQGNTNHPSHACLDVSLQLWLSKYFQGYNFKNNTGRRINTQIDLAFQNSLQ